MSVDVETSCVIDRPREAVAAFAADPANAPAWYENIKSVEVLTPPPLGVGSKAIFVAEFLSRRLAYTYEVVEWVPSERLVMRTAEGPFPMQTAYGFEDAGEGRTRMTLRNTGSPSGFSKLMAPLMEGAMRKANRKDLDRLKQILEQDAAAS